MPAFRFRAAAALELRQQQETAAATALARAQAHFRERDGAVVEAQAAHGEAQQRLIHLERTGTDAATPLWHRNWIVRLAADVDALRRDREVAGQAVRHAEAAWRDARQKRLALERLRQRAWRRHLHVEQQQELKVIDELARLRFVMPDRWRDDS
jgi:flagellar export protein FliJ